MNSNIFIECFKVQFLTDILASNSKLPKCGIAVFCDMFIAQVDIAMTIKKFSPQSQCQTCHSLVHCSLLHSAVLK